MPRSISKNMALTSSISRKLVLDIGPHNCVQVADPYAAAKNHKHSMNNPYSQFQNGWSEEQILDAPKICNQLTKLMCSPTSVRRSVRTTLLTLKQRVLYRTALHVVSSHLKTSFMHINLKIKLSKLWHRR